LKFVYIYIYIEIGLPYIYDTVPVSLITRSHVALPRNASYEELIVDCQLLVLSKWK